MSDSPVILDKYVVVRRLAMGGMGEIFLAKQRGVSGFERPVILKSLLPDLAEQEGSLDQFLDEARVAAVLNHPNVVSIIEIGAHDGVYFLVMEYIDGLNLSQMLRGADREQLRMPVSSIARIIRDAAMGLDYAHHAVDGSGAPLHIVHRDISPQNIMLRRDGLVKVVDFGIAKAMNRSTKTQAGMLKGKLHYMPPEQVRGQQMDMRSDQFSLGICLWELLTRKRLFEGDDPVTVFNKILQHKVPKPSEYFPGLPAPLEAITMKMLSDQPDHRFPRLADCAEAIDKYFAGAGGAPSAMKDPLTLLVARLLDKEREVSGPQKAVEIKGLKPPAASCSRCGHTNERAARFCMKCGNSLVAEAEGHATVASPAAGTIPSSSPPDTMQQPMDGMTALVPSSQSGSGPNALPGAPRAVTMEQRGSDVPQQRPASQPPMAGLAGMASDLQRAVASERRTVTIVRASVSGLVTNASLDDEAILVLGDRLVDDAVRIIGSVGGLVEATSSGEMTWIFGSERVQEDDPVRALRAALSFKDAVKAIGAEVKLNLKLKAGIDVGQAVVRPGARGKKSSAAGAPLDRASLLGRFADDNNIVATKAVIDFSQRRFRFGPMSSFGGGSDSIEGAVVLGVNEQQQQQVTGAFIGRAAEKKLITDALKNASQGMTSAFLLSGGPGSGKSALLDEAVRIATAEGIRAVRARPKRQELSLALELVRDLVQELVLAISPGPLTPERFLALEGLGVDPATIKRLSELVLGGDEAKVDADRLTEDQAAVVELILRAALDPSLKSSGIALFIDDLDRADDTSKGFVERLLSCAVGGGVFILAATTDGRLAIPGFTPHALPILTDDEIVLIARKVINDAELPPLAAQLVRSRAQGSPSFARQIIETLIEKGAIHQLGELWKATPAINKAQLPSTMSLVLESRFDALDNEAKIFLKTSALVGETFDANIIDDALGTAGLSRRVLPGLWKARLVEPIDGGTWRFLLGTMAEVIRGRTVKSEQKDLHRRIGAALTRVLPQKPELVVAAAHHLTEGGADVEALHQSIAAGRFLVARGSLEQAAEHFERAVSTGVRLVRAHAAGAPSADQLLMVAADATRARAAFDPARAAMIVDAAIDAVGTRATPAARVEALRQQGLALIADGKPAPAQRALSRALEQLGPDADPELRASVLVDLSAALEASGDLENGASYLVECVRLMQGKGARNPDFFWDLLNRLGRIHLRMKQVDRADALFMHAREQAKGAASLIGEARIVTNMAAVSGARGLMPEARERFEEALALSEKGGDRLGMARVEINLARLVASLGDTAAARGFADRALKHAQAVAWREGVALATHALRQFRA